MRDRRRRDGTTAGSRPSRSLKSSAGSFWLVFFVTLCGTLFAAVAFSAFYLFADSFHPILASTWRQPAAINAVAVAGGGDNTIPRREPGVHVHEAIAFPDQLLLFLRRRPSASVELLCLYYPPSTTTPNLRLPAVSPASHSPPLVRCPSAPRDFAVSLQHSSSPPLRPRHWDHLAYTAILDPRDNSTLVFAKGLNLRPGRLSDPDRYECLFGWNFSKPKYLLTSPAVSAAQEIIRCKTPISVLRRHHHHPSPPLVSIKSKGRRGGITLPSVARPELLSPPRRHKEHTMCICTMVRNQARFLSEWIKYHSHIGVERWFIYDNNSDDGIEQAVASLSSSDPGYKVTLHEWPWVKTQEAGFAHCALRAREACEWVGFIDVDEFLYLPSNVTLHDILRNYSGDPFVGELRTSCHSFGPSGRKTAPPEGVMVGYTCRMGAPERHKSIVRPESLNPSLINVVHHFHLKDGMRYVNIERGMVINHYKYQVWEVFKEKFFRRVATYVADWQEDENAGSKDRAPGLGTKAVEPPDWPARFCEVNDTGLRDWVQMVFTDPNTGRLPW